MNRQTVLAFLSTCPPPVPIRELLPVAAYIGLCFVMTTQAAWERKEGVFGIVGLEAHSPRLGGPVVWASGEGILAGRVPRASADLSTSLLISGAPLITYSI